MPFCVAGMGDLLALFRCISCRFNFGADPSKPEILGAPGRVYTSGKPELACNVQQYSRESYLRRAEAEQCRVQSSMLLPVFSIPPSTANPTSSVALGVVEVVQTSDDMDFLPVARLLGTVLIKCGLYTSSIDEVESRLPTAATNLQLPNRTGLLEDDHGDAGNNGSSDIGEAGSAKEEVKSGLQQESSEHQQQRQFANGEDYEMDNESDEDDNDDGDNYEPGKPRTMGRGQRRRSLDIARAGSGAGARRNANSSAGGNTTNGKYKQSGIRNAKSGVKLTLADLQGQFGVGLKEAAGQLGVCTTTLKRACRRHGIQRWPRRALQKVSRTLDEMERRGALEDNMVEAVPMGSLIHPTTGQFMIPPPPMAPLSLPFEEMPVDLRWAALANMIPKLNGSGFTVQTGATALPVLQPAMPSPSDFSLEGAVTIGDGYNGSKNNNHKAMNVGIVGINKGNLTAGTGGTSGWDQQQVGTAAGAAAAVAAQAAAQRHHLVPAAAPVQVVPSYLRNGSFESPFDRHAPVLQLPGAVSAPSEGPAMSFPFSQMSLPSFGPSFMAPSSLIGGLDGGLDGVDGLPATRDGVNQIGTTATKDDVGLLDSTILELMLAEDSRTLVGASDEELKRMFPSPPAQAPCSR
jgi:hypothetical protein